MYISEKKIRLLEQIMWGLNETRSNPEVREFIGPTILELLDADYFASFKWDGNRRTFTDRVFINMNPDNMDAYDRYYQHCDPITSKLQQRSVPTLVNQVMPQQDLIRTEFFNDFLARDGLKFGINMFAFDGTQNIGDIRVWRGGNRENFDHEAVQMLSIIQPAFTNALQRAALQAAQPMAAADAHVKKPDCLERLSERERVLAKCVCRGLSDKAIAKELGIEFSTVRTHLSKIFKKFNAENRTQLVQYILENQSEAFRN